MAQEYPGRPPHELIKRLQDKRVYEKKRAAYADSLILTILKFQCLAGIIRNRLISRSISSAGLQKRHRVWLHPCTFRELYRG